MKRILLVLSIATIQILIFSINAKADGEVDLRMKMIETFGGVAVGPIQLQSDGKLIIAGRVSPPNDPQGVNRLYRFNQDGTYDPTFSAPVPTVVDAFIVMPDDRIMVAYRHFYPHPYTMIGVSRLLPNGAIDPTFDFNNTYLAEGRVNLIGLNPDGAVLIAGDIKEKNEARTPHNILKLNSNGTADALYNGDNGSLVSFLERQSGTEYVLINRGGIITRLDAAGNQDPGFTIQIGTPMQTADGKFLLSSTNAVRRYRQNGQLDASFQFTSPTEIRLMGSFQDGRVLIWTDWTSVEWNKYAILDQSGHLFRTFGTSFGRVTFEGDRQMWGRSYIHIGGIEKMGIFRRRLDFTPTRRKAFDFDGDGKADIAVFRPSNGVWYIMSSANGTFIFTKFGLAGDIPATADYDGDGKADICVYRPSNGIWYRLNSSDGSFYAQKFGLAEDIPVQFDYDADGRDDIAVFRPSDGNWYRLHSSDGSFKVDHFGASGDRPFPGDYDGDGKADLSVWRASESLWYVWLSQNGAVTTSTYTYYDGHYGTPADFDGDGRLDLYNYRTIIGTYVGLQSGTARSGSIQWGMSGDVPTAADYDGDGREDLAVWRPSDGTWWIRNSWNNSVTTYQFGLNGDIPIESTYFR